MWRFILPFLILASLLASPVARSDPLESLLMPGKVISGHAKFENNCKKCHANFRKKSQNSRCLECHKSINKDIIQKSGYHGRIKGMPTRLCQSCHSEHLGRKADIIGLEKSLFDHRKTDFVLKGGHLNIKCESCHKPGRKYRDTASMCYACHKSDDRHKGRLGKNCQNCHVETGWSKAKFDHSKTHFPLKFSHQNLACNSCHLSERYKKTPTKCFGCHQFNDEHYGRFGTACEKCHVEKKWNQVTFRHNRDTKFTLDGQHTKTACMKCHTGTLFKEHLSKTCIGCHKFDDEHKGSNGTQCQKCHTTRGWKKTSFDHDRDTRFTLRGRHKAALCIQCHSQDPYKDKLERTCIACHKKDDVHKGNQGKQCQRCHNESGWRADVKFDHDLSDYPLLGLHAITPCEACHRSLRFKEAPRKCVGCHKKDDFHQGSLGADCASCHNPNAWNIWKFDHTRSTDYPLEGAHDGLECQACHLKGKQAKLPTNCIGCHGQDDVHSGNFGKNCEQCHDSTSFKSIRLKLK